jgi:hypothetical protein
VPVWHVSVSLQRKGRFANDEARLQRLSVAALDGVGGDHEWWVLRENEATGLGWVGHLRVPVTLEEAGLIPPGLVTTDAGETGPLRPRTSRR